ncbi:sulfurtransferase TusA family protein [Vibrio sp.]|nr:sulfurtransferase TusA family protein [Vibrio sp.]
MDLTKERCPMSLLLVKRYVVKMEVGEQVTVLLRDLASFSDIQHFLKLHGYDIHELKIGDNLALIVNKV